MGLYLSFSLLEHKRPFYTVWINTLYTIRRFCLFLCGQVHVKNRDEEL